MQSRDMLTLDRHLTSMPFPSEMFIYDEVGKMKKHTEENAKYFHKNATRYLRKVIIIT